MNKHLLGMGILLVTHVSCVGQVVDVKEVRTVNTSGTEETVTNMNSSHLVAFHLTLKCGSTTSHSSNIEYRYDAFLHYGHDTPLWRQEATSVSLPATAIDCTGGVDAAIFSDGRVEGDPSAIKDIYLRREGVLDAITFAKTILTQITESKLSVQDAITKLKDRQRAVASSTDLSLQNREGQMFAFGSVVVLLRTQRNMLVPSDHGQHRDPRIEQVMQSNGVTRSEAHAMVINKKLDEWASDVKLNGPPGDPEQSVH